MILLFKGINVHLVVNLVKLNLLVFMSHIAIFLIKLKRNQLKMWNLTVFHCETQQKHIKTSITLIYLMKLLENHV
jgi:hypothetical protein